MRSKKSEELVLKQVRNEYKFKQNDKNVEAFLATVDSTILDKAYKPADNVKMNDVLFSLQGEPTKVSDFIDYINNHMTKQRFVTPATYAYQLYENFCNETVMNYADSHLEEKYPEFKALVQEYKDGCGTRPSKTPSACKSSMPAMPPNTCGVNAHKPPSSP